MSWQAYIDSSLVGTGCVDKAAIFDVTGKSVWAASADFTPVPEEIQSVIASFAEQEPKKIWGTGFKIEGEKYVTIKAEDRSVYGKKGKEGVLIVKTIQALLVAHYPETVQPGQTTVVVEKLADYLIGVGY